MTLGQLRRRFEWLLETLAMLMVISLTVVVLLGVIFRFSGHSLSWYDEVASVLLAWVTYYGAALAAAKRGHISVPGVLYAQPPRVRLVLLLIAEACIIAFFVLLAFYGVHVLQLLAGQTLVSVPIPVEVTKSAIPIGAALFVIAELLNLPDMVREALEGRRREPEEDTSAEAPR